MFPYPEPASVGLVCRHRRAKTVRRGLCPKCYQAYLGAVSPDTIQRIKDATRRSWIKHRERRLAELRAFHASRAKWKTRDVGMRRDYGITIFQYGEMRRTQGGLCCICGRRPLRLTVDHDHATGRVRGLLCLTCNRGLQIFSDSPDRFRLAADYLAGGFDGRSVVPRRNILGRLLALAKQGPRHFAGSDGGELVVMTSETFTKMI